MARKSHNVHDLVVEVLRDLPQPYREDIILEVSRAINRSAAYRLRYDQLVDELGLQDVQRAIAHHARRIAGRERTVAMRLRDKLIASYKKLRP